MYYVDKSLIKQSRTIASDEKDEFYLSVIENTMMDIASYCKNREELEQIIKDTAAKVREHNFELIVKVKTLSKISPNKQYKAETYKKITKDGERDYVLISDKSNNTVKYNINHRYDTIAIENKVQKCKWINDEFLIMDRFDKVFVTINAKEQRLNSIFWRELKEDMWPRVE